jgi:hypothetical protein
LVKGLVLILVIVHETESVFEAADLLLLVVRFAEFNDRFLARLPGKFSQAPIDMNDGFLQPIDLARYEIPCADRGAQLTINWGERNLQDLP